MRRVLPEISNHLRPRVIRALERRRGLAAVKARGVVDEGEHLLGQAQVLHDGVAHAAHRRERQQTEAHQVRLIRQYQGLRRLRDRFAAGQTGLEKLLFQLRQSPTWQEYFEPQLYDLATLHQHEA